MKFLCEHCKAKYQIADEKVAGRTVRMKCRKCGQMIEVRAAVTETSVNAKLPTDPPPKGPQAPSAYEGGKAPRPGRTPMATSLSSAPKPAPARPAAPTERADRATGLAGAFHRNVQKEEEISVALDLRELSAADEWYVAINGVPVGPIRVAELRRKAAIGVVNEDSLCWQEGMEEWRPVKAVTELAALVREAAAGGRVSLVTPPPPESRPSNNPPPARPGSVGSARPAGLAPAAPRTPMGAHPQEPRFSPPFSPPAPPVRPGAPLAPTARSNVVPFTSRLATAEKLNDEPAVGMVTADPFAAAPPPPSPFQAGAGSAAAGQNPFGPPTPAPAGFGTGGFTPSGVGQTGSHAGAVADPFAASSAASASSAAPSLAPGVPVQKRGPLVAIALIVLLAAAFGFTAALVIVKPAPQQVVVQAPVAAPAPPPVAQAPTASAAAADSAAVAPATSTGSTAKVASGARPGAAGTKPGTTAKNDLGIGDLLNSGPSGPTPGAGDNSASTGAQLTEDQVKSVLGAHTLAVKRTCWERIQTQSSSVNETVHIVVGATGQVSSATATGNDPVVGHCIEGEVKRWSFPGQGAIDIPFHFLRQ